MAFTETFGGTTIYPSDVSYIAYSLTADLTLAWPMETATNGNVVAQIMDVTPNAGGRKIIMPPANEASPGETALFFNAGSYSFTVADSLGNTIVSIAPGLAYQVYLTTNTTAAGTWRTTQFGAGTSSATAGSLVGYGIKAINSTLNQSMSVTSLSVNYTAGAADRSAAFLWTGGAGVITLPAASSVGNDWFFHIRNGGTGAISVETTGGELINGSSSVEFNPGDSSIIVCDGSGYFTIGFGQAPEFLFDFVSIDLTGQTSPYTLAGANLNRIAYQFSGTLTTNMEVVVPATIQQYWVGNSTTGGSYTLTIKTAAGTGVPVARGSRNILYCNGTDVVLANTGEISIPILVSQGGTGATTASGARTNLGATSIGNALFTAVDEATARNAIIAAKSGANSDITSLSGLTTPLSVAQGGTGAATLTSNGVVYGSGTSAVGITAAGTTGQVLVGNTGGAPSWAALSGIGVTSLSFGSTGLTPSTATQGAITVAGTLAAANGGTGQSSYTIGDILYASGATTLSKLADVATGNALISGGVGVAPSWGKIGLTTHVTGTLPVANGGTGATTLTSGYLVKGNGTSAVSASVIYDNGTNVGFNATSLGGGSGAYRFAGNVTGATTSVGILYTPTVSSDVTGIASVFLSQPSTQAAAFTLSDLRHFQVNQGTIGASSAVTSQYGFYAGSALTGATNNYAFYSGIASGTGRWNLYMAGNADNYLAGNLGIGTTAPTAKLNVVDASVNDALRITQTGTGNALVVEDSANPDSTPFVILADGRSVQGHTSTFNFSGASYLSEALGSGSNYPFAAGYTGASATGPRLALVKNRSANWSTNTTVQSGDQLGDISFTGSDGTDFVRGAAITASVDGTPGTNDMPGRLVFSTTAAGSFSPTERMRIDSSGNVGIGTSSPSTKVDVSVAGGMLRVGGASGNNLIQSYTSSGSTGLGLWSGGLPRLYSTGDLYFSVNATLGTAAPSAYYDAMMIASGGNVGIGTSAPGNKLDIVSAGSSQIRVKDGVGATSYYDFGRDGTDGFFGFSGAQTTFSGYKWSVNAGTEVMRITNGGNVGIGTSSPGGTLAIGGSLTGSTNSIGVYNNQAIQSDVTSSATVFSTFPSTAAATFTLTNLTHYSASQGSLGASSAITTQIGFAVQSTMTGATNNYGFYSAIASGTGRYNLYIAGTANNYIQGNLGLGTSSPSALLDIGGVTKITSTGVLTSADLADAVGYKGIPQNAQTGAYTLALSDIGKHVSNTTGGFVIPANGSVAFPIGSTVVLFNNSGSTQTITITTDTLRQAGTTNTGTRTLAVYGVATCIKVAATVWVVSGNVT